MEYMNVNVYYIEGTHYLELGKIELNNDTYLVLSDENDESKLLVQKLENNELVDVVENVKIYVIHKYIESIKNEE